MSSKLNDFFDINDVYDLPGSADTGDSVLQHLDATKALADATGIPVLWLICKNGNPKAPWGRVVQL